MDGLMMDTPLTINLIMRHAEQQYADTGIVSITADEPRHRYTYADAFARARRLASVLAGWGLARGDRVATLAWNDHRHFELYYGVSCSGAICHTINPRLFPEQLVYILNHAADRWLFVDPMFVPLVEQLRPQLTALERVIVLAPAQAMPESALPLECYEQLLAGASEHFTWPALDEREACGLCYTSGTTGNPKGVLYNHRSTVLHAMAANMRNTTNLGPDDCALAVVPMFHANAWGLPYNAPMVGARLVFPGNRMGDPATLQQLIEEEQVTFCAGVPTIWLALLDYLDRSGKRIDSLHRTLVGGAAVSGRMTAAYRERYGVSVEQGWGMTELSPIGTTNMATAAFESLAPEARRQADEKIGKPVFGVEAKLTGPDGASLPWDGASAGHLKVRGPWVCSGYFGLDTSAAHDADGWFDTGDMAVAGPDGRLQITDRTKDVIKSGGEWISSIDLEKVAMTHPEVALAAVIAVPHPRWSERPLLVVRAADGHSPSADALLAWFEGKVASWWVPDDVVFIDDMPLGATGKIDKKHLRARFEAHTLPETAGGEGAGR